MLPNSTLTWIDIPIFNQLVPKEGPKSIQTTLDFSVQSSYSYDFGLQVQRGFIREFQTIFVDNSLNPQAFNISILNTNQVVIIPPYCQAYIPILCPNPPKITFSSGGAVLVKLQLLNIPMPAAVWNTRQFAPSFDVDGKLLVSDPVLDAALGSTPISTEPVVTGNQDLQNPLYKATRSFSGSFANTTPVSVITGNPGWLLGGLILSLSGLSTLAAAADVNVAVASGGTTLFTTSVTVPSTASNTTQVFFSNTNLYMSARANNDALTLTLNTALATGFVRYQAFVSACSLVGI